MVENLLLQAYALSMSQTETSGANTATTSQEEEERRRRMHAEAAEKRLRGDSHLRVEKKYVRDCDCDVQFVRSFVVQQTN